MRIETSSPQETEAAGARLAAGLRPGDVVLVAGELGSGKTTLVRGASRALGVTEPVTSPTFTIGQLYAGALGGHPLEVAHVDLYRLDSLAGEDPALLEDYLRPQRIGFVEWPGPVDPGLEALAPGARVAARIELAHAGDDRRTITVERAAGAHPA
jgi:tRNA threonylcarbamoyladenosine biosynthesis protein TsaE